MNLKQDVYGRGYIENLRNLYFGIFLLRLQCGWY